MWRCVGDVKWGRGQAEGYLDERKLSLGELDPPLFPLYEQDAVHGNSQETHG